MAGAGGAGLRVRGGAAAAADAGPERRKLADAGPGCGTSANGCHAGHQGVKHKHAMSMQGHACISISQQTFLPEALAQRGIVHYGAACPVVS